MTELAKGGAGRLLQYVTVTPDGRLVAVPRSRKKKHQPLLQGGMHNAWVQGAVAKSYLGYGEYKPARRLNADDRNDVRSEIGQAQHRRMFGEPTHGTTPAHYHPNGRLKRSATLHTAAEAKEYLNRSRVRRTLRAMEDAMELHKSSFGVEHTVSKSRQRRQRFFQAAAIGNPENPGGPRMLYHDKMKTGEATHEGTARFDEKNPDAKAHTRGAQRDAAQVYRDQGLPSRMLPSEMKRFRANSKQGRLKLISAQDSVRRAGTKLPYWAHMS